MARESADALFFFMQLKSDQDGVVSDAELVNVY